MSLTGEDRQENESGVNHQNRLHFGRVEFVGEEKEERQEERERDHQTVVEDAVDKVKIPRFHSVQLNVNGRK